MCEVNGVAGGAIRSTPMLAVIERRLRPVFMSLINLVAALRLSNALAGCDNFRKERIFV